MEKKLIVGGIVVCLLLVASVLYIAANATIPWAEYKVQGFSDSIQYGLWKYKGCGSCTESEYACSSTTTSTTGNTFSSDKCSRLFAGRAFVTLACILTPFAAVMLVIILVLKKFQNPFLLIMKAFNAACFLIGLIGTIIGSYATVTIIDLTGSATISVSTGIGLSIAATVIHFIALTMSMLVRQGAPAV